MRCAYGVHAHILQDGKLTLRGGTIYRRAERSEVVVHTSAVELKIHAVQEEALCAVEPDGSISYALLPYIRTFAVYDKLCPQSVQVRVINAPKVRLSYIEALRYLLCAPLKPGLARGDRFSITVEQDVPYRAKF